MLNMKCLPRSRGVPTSFYKLNMMFLTNRGTPEYYFPYTQIRAIAHLGTIDGNPQVIFTNVAQRIAPRSRLGEVEKDGQDTQSCGLRNLHN